MLQGRLLSYPDAHRYRLGVNYEQISVNQCPYKATNYQRDGQMRVDHNGEDTPNYYPNSFDDIYADESYKEPAMMLDSSVADWFDRNAPGEDDHYTQPGWFFSRVLKEHEQNSLISNIVNSMRGITGPKKGLIISRQLCHFFRCDPGLGMSVAKGLDVNMQEIMQELNKRGAEV